MRKRLISILLALCIALSLLPLGTAFAAASDEVPPWLVNPGDSNDSGDTSDEVPPWLVNPDDSDDSGDTSDEVPPWLLDPGDSDDSGDTSDEVPPWLVDPDDSNDSGDASDKVPPWLLDPGGPDNSDSTSDGPPSWLQNSNSSEENTASSDGSPSAAQSRNITVGNQEIAVTIKNGVVEMSAEESQITDMIASSAKEGIVRIDMSSVEDVSEIYIPHNVVDSINSSESVSCLSIAMEAGSIEISGEALNTVSVVLTGNNDQVSFKIDTINVDTLLPAQKNPVSGVLNSAVFIDLSAGVIHKDETGQTISTETIHELNGNVTVSVPYKLPADTEERQTIACHIAEDGTVTCFPVKYEDGAASFTTTHFSTFAVAESRAAAFEDIDISAWYIWGVEYVLGSGLMNGMGGGLFTPGGTTTRGMIMTILARMDGADTSGSSPWYQAGMEWAMQAGVSDGTTPEGEITREQFAAMLWRYAGEPVVTGDLSVYSDAGNVHGWAGSAMVWAVQNDIIRGSYGSLNPQGSTLRSEAAAMLTRFCQSLET